MWCDLPIYHRYQAALATSIAHRANHGTGRSEADTAILASALLCLAPKSYKPAVKIVRCSTLQSDARSIWLSATERFGERHHTVIAQGINKGMRSCALFRHCVPTQLRSLDRFFSLSRFVSINLLVDVASLTQRNIQDSMIHYATAPSRLVERGLALIRFSSAASLNSFSVAIFARAIPAQCPAGMLSRCSQERAV